MASIMEVLTKTAVAEITKLVDDGSAALRLEMCRSQRENEALKRKLLQMERERAAARGYGEGAPDNSLNIALEVQFCDEFREVQRRTLGAAAAGADGSAGPLCGEEELHMQPCPAGDPEKGLQAELKQEPEEEPLTPALPPLGSADWGLELQCAWSLAGGLGMVQEKHGQFGGSLEHRGAQLDDDFSPPHYRASQRQCLEVDEGPTSHLKQQQNGGPLAEEHSHGPSDYISAEIPLPLGSPGEHGGSTPCEASFDTSAEAKSHRRIEGQEDFICTRSQKTFPDALELRTHEEQHCSGKLFSCSECGKGFTSSRVLKKHQQVHSRKKQFACSYCDKSFSQWQVFQEHESIHTGLKPYVCAECGKSFRHKGSFKIHQDFHTRGKPFSCLQCGKCFRHMSSLKTHQITHTREKRFSCTMCNKTFASLTVLVQHHQSAHAGDKYVICTFCGKVFDSADFLEQHRLAHHGGNWFSCTLCGKGFTSKGNLKIHQSVHTGEKPHGCSECGKSFAHLGNLKTHQRVHTKPFCCTLCGKGFSQDCAVQKHMFSHSKE